VDGIFIRGRVELGNGGSPFIVANHFGLLAGLDVLAEEIKIENSRMAEGRKIPLEYQVPRKRGWVPWWGWVVSAIILITLIAMLGKAMYVMYALSTMPGD
jgi:hypothetical protein